MENNTSHSVQPIRERHGFVDALRGFALLGIIAVNIEFIVQPLDVGWYEYDGTIDKFLRWLSVTLLQAKIYPIFALLFGYGLALQSTRAEAADDALWPRYCRRLLGLVALGVLHAVLFFPGDILVLYAVIGALAYRFRKTASRRLVIVAIWSYAVSTLIWFAVGVLDYLWGFDPLEPNAETIRILSEGSYIATVGVHLREWLFAIIFVVLVQGPAVFACFLAGIALGRTTWLEKPDRHRALANRVFRFALPAVIVAAVGGAWIVNGGHLETLGFALNYATAPMIAATYIAGLSLLVGGDSARAPSRVIGLLRQTGRMSLSVYLLQSVVATTIAYGYGYGWFAQTPPLAGLALAVAIWLALSLAAVAWLRFARFGPFEWLLRSMTYKRWQPLWR